MSLWGVHIGFAATLTTLVLTRTALRRSERWFIIGASGFWAVIPDFYHFIPGVRVWYKPLLHDSILANVFWFHQLIDILDTQDSSILSLAMFGLFILTFLSAELWIVAGG